MNLSIVSPLTTPSLISGYQITPCSECSAPISTRVGEPIPERCSRSGCYKFDAFPMVCLAVSLLQGKSLGELFDGFKTIQHRGVVSLVTAETSGLRQIVAADFRSFWIPRRAEDRKRFNLERRLRSRSHVTLRPPVWHPDERPVGMRRVKLHSSFSAASFIDRLCRELGYPNAAAFASRTSGHKPWLHISDRRSAGKYKAMPLADPEHPYIPASPERRTQVGGGLTEERVHEALGRMRTDSTTKAALIEIVYRRRSTQKVAQQFQLSTAKLYVYASRLRRHISDGNLHAEGNLPS